MSYTDPITVNHITFGETEAETKPFERADYDFTRQNDYMRTNPANTGIRIPDAIISNCSECCMTEINGKPNTLGLLFRKSRKGKGCWRCPVQLASEQLPARKADGTYVKDQYGKILSEADIIRLACDSET